MNITWKHFAPVAVGIAIALIPAPEGLSQHAWYYFAIFAGVIVGLIFEPLPGGAIGLIGVTLVTVLAEHVCFAPEEFSRMSGIYFSAVTLATLGYGDIVPSTEGARSRAIVEGVGGQLFLALMLARLVNLYTGGTQMTSRSTPYMR